MIAEQHSFGFPLFFTFTSNPTVNSRPMFCWVFLLNLGCSNVLATLLPEYWSKRAPERRLITTLCKVCT